MAEPISAYLITATAGAAFATMLGLVGCEPEAREMAPVVPAPLIVPAPEYVTPESTMPVAPPQTWTYGPGVDPEAVAQ